MSPASKLTVSLGVMRTEKVEMPTSVVGLEAKAGRTSTTLFSSMKAKKIGKSYFLAEFGSSRNVLARTDNERNVNVK
jgi:hypothetical protein